MSRPAVAGPRTAGLVLVTPGPPGPALRRGLRVGRRLPPEVVRLGQRREQGGGVPDPGHRAWGQGRELPAGHVVEAAGQVTMLRPVRGGLGRIKPAGRHAVLSPRRPGPRTGAPRTAGPSARGPWARAGLAATPATGLAVPRRVVTGLVVTGLVVTGLVVTRPTETGLVIAGLVIAGLIGTARLAASRTGTPCITTA